jgi:arginine repressor
MNFREQKIFEIISEKNILATPQIREKLLEQGITVSEMTITRDIKNLISENILEKTGKGKATEYRISKCTYGFRKKTSRNRY